MKTSPITVALLAAALHCTPVFADGLTSQQGHAHGIESNSATLRAPHLRLSAPPDAQTSASQTVSKTPRASAQNSVAAACDDVSGFTSRSGAALADFIASLPTYTCTYNLFNLSAADAQNVYSTSNMQAVANKLSALASGYNASTTEVDNLVLYFRAGYYLANGLNRIPAPSASIDNALFAILDNLLANTRLFNHNAAAPTTANEVLTLVTNMKAEARYLATMKTLVQRYTNTSSNPSAVNSILNATGRAGFTGVLTVLYRVHSDSAANNVVRSDFSYSKALFDFVQGNKSQLLGTSDAFQLTDSLNESFRFMQYGTLLPQVKPNVKTILSQHSMTGSGSDLWLAAASAVEYYDNASCSEYGTCNYKTQLAAQVLPIQHTCSSTIKIRAQEMSSAQLQDSCNKLTAGESYFHSMMQTGNTPVRDDNNSNLEVVVFDDYTNYDKYAGVLFGINTDNGGMYLEGNPAQAGNQARFIAHEASWLRPTFQVWNLEHEYVHYLDGRFNLYGDFSASTSKPTVWWLEGLGEYLSLKNNNQTAIDAAKTGTYKLSTIFNNTYDMSDYTARAYRWGYMAVRFMNEKHRADINAILPKLRSGDYAGYWTYMQNIGTRYDAEFASWVQTATTSGEPPLPGGNSGGVTLLNSGTAVAISGAQGSQVHYAIDVPAGQSKLEIKTSGGSGDVDLYVRQGSQASLSQYDQRPYLGGNNETVTLNNPVAGRYYVMLHGYSAYAGASLVATLTAGGGTPPTGTPCTSSSSFSENNCIISNKSGTDTNPVYLSIWVPNGAKNFYVNSSGGSGDATLYMKAGNWPSTSSYTLKSANTGNTEAVSQASPAGGQWHYIMITGSFSGLSIKAGYTP